MEVVTRLGIADASTLLREGLMRVLGDKKDVSVVGQAANDVETMELVEQRNNVDVLLLDLNIPKLEAIPILLALKEQNLATKVLILSHFTDESKILNSAKVGARQVHIVGCARGGYQRSVPGKGLGGPASLLRRHLRGARSPCEPG